MSKYDLKTGTLTIEYECQLADPSDPTTTDYFEVTKVSSNDQELNVCLKDLQALEKALQAIWNHSTIKE